MRTLEKGHPDGEGYNDGNGWKIVDWKDPPHEVLESIYDLLAPFGLEVVQYETWSSWYKFKIEKIK